MHPDSGNFCLLIPVATELKSFQDATLGFSTLLMLRIVREFFFFCSKKQEAQGSPGTLASSSPIPAQLAVASSNYGPIVQV